MAQIELPHLGYATAEGTVLRWLKSVGESVAVGEPLVDLASEKAIQVLAALETGTLLAIYAPPGAVVAEGEALGWIGAAGTAAPALRPRILDWEEDIAPRPPGFEPAVRPRKVDPAALARPAGAPPRAERDFLRRQLRKVTAQRMAASWREAPKVDLFADVDFGAVMAHRAMLKHAGQEAPSYNVYIAHAVVRAFKDFPELNRHWVGERCVPLDGIHVGIAVASGESLMTVSMKHLDGLGLLDLQRQFKGLLKKALGMSLAREELYGSSLTVTNLGEWDITTFTAVLNPPEIFILAIGKLEERAVVRNGAVTVVPQSTFCLSFDHRGVDGAPASRLLQRIKQHLESYPG